MPRIGNGLLFAVVAAGVIIGSSASSTMAGAEVDSPTIQTVTKLTSRAVREYEDLNFDGARKTLETALKEGTRAGSSADPKMADVHVLLGVVILAQPGHPHDEAVAEFRQALKLRPSIALSTEVANPDIQQVFDEAKSLETAGGAAASNEKPAASDDSAGTRAEPTGARRPEQKAETAPKQDDAEGGGAGEEAADVAEAGEEEDAAGDVRRWYVGVGLGSGLGWTSGAGEVTDTNVSSGFRPSSMAHVLPEVGYFVRRDVLLSLQLRVQFISGATSERDPSMSMCGSDHVCSPTKGATAVFARAVWFLRDATMFRPFVSAAVGVGQVRHVVSVPGAAACGDDAAHPVACVDTVAAGPVFLGPGGGVTINLLPAFALVLGANSLIGFPRFTAHVDLDVGAAVAF